MEEQLFAALIGLVRYGELKQLICVHLDALEDPAAAVPRPVYQDLADTSA